MDRSSIWEHYEIQGDCWISTLASDGHGFAIIVVDGRFQRVHRVAYELTEGAIPRGQYVLQHCEHKRCINPAHLYLGDRHTIAAIKTRKGRHGPALHPERMLRGENHGLNRHPESRPKGERNGQAKLTWAAVREIRSRWAAGVSLEALAAEYGLSRSGMYYIVTNRRWKEAEDTPTVLQ